MSRVFTICLHDYETNTTKSIGRHNSWHDAMLSIEDHLSDTQEKIQGDKPYAHSNNIANIHNLKYGMFVLTYPKRYGLFTIWRRLRVDGWFTSYVDKEIYDIFIVEEVCHDNVGCSIDEEVAEDNKCYGEYNVIVEDLNKLFKANKTASQILQEYRDSRVVDIAHSIVNRVVQE